MIKQFANRITSFLIHENIIEQEDYEVYKFGIERIIRTLIMITIIVLLTWVMKSWWITTGFGIGFIPLRRIGGGYHASTRFGCNLMTLSIFLFDTVIVLIFYDKITNFHLLLISLTTLVLIFKYAPVDHKNLVFSKQRVKKARNMVRVVSTLMMVAVNIYIFANEEINILFLSVVIGAATSAVSIVIGNIKRKEEKDENNAVVT